VRTGGDPGPQLAQHRGDAGRLRAAADLLQQERQDRDAVQVLRRGGLHDLDQPGAGDRSARQRRPQLSGEQLGAPGGRTDMARPSA
jgi:hypothetical protein